MFKHLEKGGKVRYADAKPGDEGVTGEVISDGVNKDGFTVVRWNSPSDKNCSWTMLEDARDLAPVAVTQ